VYGLVQQVLDNGGTVEIGAECVEQIFDVGFDGRNMGTPFEVTLSMPSF
jgi:hypothetical protein